MHVYVMKAKTVLLVNDKNQAVRRGNGKKRPEGISGHGKCLCELYYQTHNCIKYATKWRGCPSPRRASWRHVYREGR